VLANREELAATLPALAGWNPGAASDMTAPLHEAARGVR
jgi:hypothetical protein